MGKTEAELSKILGGLHNLTLRTIAKLEAALGSVIICTPRNKKISFPVKTEYSTLKELNEEYKKDKSRHGKSNKQKK